MKSAFPLLLSSLIIAQTGFSQQAVDVTDQTIKIGGLKEEEMFFAFAAGDQVIFDFRETDNKELKEVEILEYPSNSKFADFKTSRVESKRISVNQQSVYRFRFYNGAIGGRICKVKIQRIPASESTRSFNTNIQWITKQDTSWNSYTKDVIAGYDTTYVQKTRKELISSEQREELIVDKPQRVHSITNSNGNKTSLIFTLPANEISAYKTKTVISWAYWVGVGEEANQAWKQNATTISSLTKGAAAYFTTPLGALAIGAVADLMIPKLGEDVYYAVTDAENKNLFMGGYEYRLYDSGKGVAGFRKFTDKGMCQGTWFICMSNDNNFQGIDATVRVAAIVETNVYADKQYTEQNVTPRYEKKIFRDPVISTKKVPIMQN